MQVQYKVSLMNQAPTTNMHMQLHKNVGLMNQTSTDESSPYLIGMRLLRHYVPRNDKLNIFARNERDSSLYSEQAAQSHRKKQ